MNFSDLKGKTLTRAEKVRDDRMLFEDSDGKTYALYHSQDCCESVNIEDVSGDLSDLVDSPILIAEESSSNTDPEGYKRDWPPESVTWTFYRIGTIKGTVVIRWLGESNGYYSESVEFAEA